MSNEPNLNNSDFKTVFHKRNGKCTKKTVFKHQILHLSEDLPFRKESAIRRIEDLKTELLNTDFYDSVTASLKEGLCSLDKPIISKIVCLGLGKIEQCIRSRYQLALLLCLKEQYDVEVVAYDPLFSENDNALLEHFNINVLKENLEAKFKICDKDKAITLFYLPHCPKQLTNNLLWANWGLNLSYCIIIANSFSTIIENSTKRTLKDSAEYILNISPYVLELAIINSFKYFEVFNDTAIHVFPSKKLSFITKDFWESNLEPSYIEDDIEFITNKINSEFVLK